MLYFFCQNFFLKLDWAAQEQCSIAVAKLTESASLKWNCSRREAVPGTLAVAAFQWRPFG